MKPKHQRIHYARKQLHKTDPRRYCRYNKFVHLHEVDGPITAYIVDELCEDGFVRYHAYCRHCDARLEAEWPINLHGRSASWSELEWRGELYIIEELPV